MRRPLHAAEHAEAFRKVRADQPAEQKRQRRLARLLVVDQDYMLKGLITVKDIQKAVKYPNACKDSLGRLRVAAAIGVARDTMDRAHALVDEMPVDPPLRTTAGVAPRRPPTRFFCAGNSAGTARRCHC